MSSELPFRRETITASALASLTRFDHPHGAPLHKTEEEAADRFQINIVVRGWFRLGYESRESTLGPGDVFLSRPGDVYRYAHMRHLDADVCLSLSFSSTLSDDLAEAIERIPIVVPQSNRLGFLGLRLGSLPADGDAVPLEDLACELVDAAGHAQTDRHRLYRPAQLQSYSRRITAAREMMEADPAGRHTLPALARQVAMSPFLFARLFRELIGIPPHKYLLRVRLRHARALLEQGMSVTEACYTSGFNNLSHFIKTFRARYGGSPSDFKR